MKKFLLILSLIALAGILRAQSYKSLETISFDTVGGDTVRAIEIIDRYCNMVDFMQYRTDSILCVTSYVVDQESPGDTMTIYRWYKAPYYTRIEIWQGGRMEDGYRSDGRTFFRGFNKGRREWADMTQDSYYGIIMPLDIRGALYNWRDKGAEPYYAGEYNYKGHPVDRVFVTCPGIFDRYYFFEKRTGFLGFVVEDIHIYGDQERLRNALKVDWRSWNEFTPVNGHYLPSVESYKAGAQTVVIKHNYHYEAPGTKYFTEDYYK